MDTLKNSSIRRKLKNGYNAHRDALNRNDKYRKEIISSIVLFKPLFALTELINSRLSKHLVSRSLPNKHSSAQ